MSVFSFVVTFFLPQHGTNCRTVLLLVGSRYSIFLCFLGVFFFSSCASSQFAAQVTMTFSTRTEGQKNKREKPSPTMYIYCLCISKITHSVQTKLLRARARLQECVPDFFFSSNYYCFSLYPILQFDKNCLPSSPDVESSGHHHLGTLTPRVNYKTKIIQKIKKKETKKQPKNKRTPASGHCSTELKGCWGV